MELTYLINSTSNLGKSLTGVSKTNFEKQWETAKDGTIGVGEGIPVRTGHTQRSDVGTPNNKLPPYSIRIDPYGTGSVSNPVANYRLLADLYDEMMAIFAVGEHEYFEAGMDSMFSRNLIARIEANGNLAISVIFYLIRSVDMDTDVASEALRRLGEIVDEETYQLRRRLLEHFLLTSKSASIRDGALHGLAYMKDPRSVPALQKALKKEPTKLLRKLMGKLIARILT
jgi:hypothetical protein